MIPLASKLGHEIILASDRPITVDLPIEGRVRTILAPARSSRLWSLFTFPKVCKVESADVAHVQYTVSPWMTIPTVTTIHDVSFLIEPKWFGWKDRTLLRLSTPSSARRAAHVIAVSETSRQEIIQLLGVPPEKVTATLLAVPSFCIGAPAPLKRIIEGSYVLFVGGLSPRKNWRGALAAVAAARKDWPELRLVITGPKRIAKEELDLSIQEFDAREWLILPGGVPESDLPSLYAESVAVIHPSLHEGFGLTPLEAFACGTPVIASNRGALPEVVGSAGQLLDVDDTSRWAAAILGLRAPESREEWIRKGRERAADFSWTDTAQRTLQVYAMR